MIKEWKRKWMKKGMNDEWVTKKNEWWMSEKRKSEW